MCFLIVTRSRSFDRSFVPSSDDSSNARSIVFDHRLGGATVHTKVGGFGTFLPRTMLLLEVLWMAIFKKKKI